MCAGARLPRRVALFLRAPMDTLKYLSAYPEHVRMQVRELIAQNRLGDVLAQRYPDTHSVRSDSALYEYVLELKNRHLRNGAPINKVMYDSGLGLVARALGTHTTVCARAGRQAEGQARNPRGDAVPRHAPPEFLKMIVVHELAHLKEREHNKAFYQLCAHMEPQYHQYEFDLRLHLTQLDLCGRQA
jgi:predicted metal-dependent hydrolase